MEESGDVGIEYSTTHDNVDDAPDASDDKRHLEYWRDALAGVNPLLELPTEYKRPQICDGRTATVELAAAVSSDVAAALEEAAAPLGADLPVVMLTTLQLVLGRYSREDDVVVGATLPETKLAMGGNNGGGVLPRAAGGPDPIPSRLSLVGNGNGNGDDEERPSLRALLQSNAIRFAAASKHPPGKATGLARRLGLAWDAAAAPVYQVALRYDDDDDDSDSDSIPPTATASGITPPLDLEFRITASSSSSSSSSLLSSSSSSSSSFLSMSLTFRTDLFTEQSSSRLLRHWAHLLGAAATSRGLDGPADRLPLMDSTERAETLRLSRGLAVDWDEDATVAEWFKRQAANHPSRPAIKFRDETIAYREFEAAVDRLARRLRLAHAADADKTVGLMMERSAEMPVAIYACARAGSAYVPVDPSLPSERMLFILRDSAVPVLLIQAKFASLIPTGFTGAVEAVDGCHHVSWNNGEQREYGAGAASGGFKGGNLLRGRGRAGGVAEDVVDGSPSTTTTTMTSSSSAPAMAMASLVPSSPFSPSLPPCLSLTPFPTRSVSGTRCRDAVASDPLYIFYTSGTTGRPKGVVVEHLGLCHRVNWLQNEYPLSPSSVLLQKAAYGFGVSEW